MKGWMFPIPYIGSLDPGTYEYFLGVFCLCFWKREYPRVLKWWCNNNIFIYTDVHIYKHIIYILFFPGRCCFSSSRSTGRWPKVEHPLGLIHVIFQWDWWLHKFVPWVVSNICYFHPFLGKWCNLTHIFQMGWNHQLVKTSDFLLLFSELHIHSSDI